MLVFGNIYFQFRTAVDNYGSGKFSKWRYWSNNDTFYTDTYGYLYNWNAIENICPGEMHIPSKNDWIELFAYLNSNSVSETSFSSKLAGYRNGYNGYC